VLDMRRLGTTIAASRREPMTLRRRTALQWGLGTLAAAATRSLAQEKYKPMFPVEQDAQLRLLRWNGFVKTDEEGWNENTKKVQEATGVPVNVEYITFEDVRPKAAMAANLNTGPDLVMGL